jgi:hypothetical protein
VDIRFDRHGDRRSLITLEEAAFAGVVESNEQLLLVVEQCLYLEMGDTREISRDFLLPLLRRQGALISNGRAAQIRGARQRPPITSPHFRDIACSVCTRI